MQLSLGAAVVLLCAAANVAWAQETTSAPAADSGRVALFDGSTLEGWKLIHCEAVVDQGEILIKGGNGLVQTQRKYGDFILEFEYKALKKDKWDSGVYFRYEDAPSGKAWPTRYQMNLREGDEGNVAGLKNATSTGLFKPHEWNKFKLTVNGTKVSLEINGKLAWKTSGLGNVADSYIGLQAEVPAGGQCRFRNIYITEIK